MKDPMARFGAALGQGFIDAGGRNVTISLQSRAGSRNTSAIVGMVMFCQFWYWYPLAHAHAWLSKQQVSSVSMVI